MVDYGSFQWPGSGAGSANASVGLNGALAPTSSTEIAGKNGGGNLTPVSVDNSGNVNVNAISSALPAGASTAAKQDTGNTSLASIDGKLASLGQKVMAGSEPVVIASDQSAIPVTGTFFQATQPVSAAALPLPAGASTSANQATEIASLASIDGKLADNYGASAGALRTAAQIGNTTGAADFGAGNSSAQTMRMVIASDQAPIAVTGGGSNASVSATGAAVPASATMVGGSDGTNLRAFKVSATGVLSVDGSAVTQPVSAASLPLPTGAATAANQATEIASLASIDAGIPAGLGQTTMAASMPVVIASNQSAVPVSISGSVPVTGGAPKVSANVNVKSAAGMGGGALTSLLYAVPANSYAVVRLVTQIISQVNGDAFVFLNDSTSTTNAMKIVDQSGSGTSAIVTIEGLHLGPGEGIYTRWDGSVSSGSLALNVVGVEFINS